jgi:hypothetical protein
MAPEQDEPQEARRHAAALLAALRRSGWYDRASLQDAAYRWAATGLPLDVVEAYLAAGIADPRVAAEFFTELGISARQIQVAGIGEQISIGRMSVEDAAKVILGPRAVGGLDQLRAALRQAPVGDPGTMRKQALRWWQARIQRLAGFLDGQPIPSEHAAWLGEQPDELLLGFRDAAVAWAGPLTIAVARQELQRVDSVLRPGGPAVSDPLAALAFGALATRELTRRLGERVEAAILSPPEYVTAMLGPYPDAELAQLTWTQTVLAVEGFRLECGIDDPDYALGAPDFNVPYAERAHFQAVNRALTKARVELEQGPRPSAVQESDAASRPAGLDRDTEVDADWGAGQLVDPDTMRPDEELAWRLRERIPLDVLPGGYLEAAAALPDEELAVRWGRAVERHLRGELWDPLRSHGGDPALWATAVSDEVARRVQARVDAIAADPPAYVTGALGPWPAEEERQGDWLNRVDQIEEYRLLTGTTDPSRALGPAPAPDSSWQQCWRRELAQDLADAHLLRMAYQHQVMGSPADRSDLAMLATSTVDPWFGMRPAGALVDESQELSVGELRHRVAAALPLLADRPENHASRLRDVQLRRANLLGYQREERVALAAAEARRKELRRVTGRGTKAARTAAQDTVDQHKEALGNLSRQLVDADQEITRLTLAQAPYFDWCRQHGLQVSQGQAAAQVLQERETRLLEDLATYPPPYLLAELGPSPSNRDGRAAWLRGAQAVERHRAAYQIADRERAYGDGYHVGRFEQPGRRQDQERVREIVDDARHVITESLAHDLDRDLSGLHEDPPQWAIGA